ncbi:MAG: hypothetical protein A4S14_18390 [Proteobacteria bacterium SG_bin9]|nr:MAG: hypothetical protein A4S14_18390 [Proteobacteria bacterium SG_bin9]
MFKTASLALLASASILAIDPHTASAQVAPSDPRVAQAEQPPVPIRVAYAERRSGGGLLEVLFNGGQPYQAPSYYEQQPRGYQQQQGYQQQYEPRYELRQQQILPQMDGDPVYRREAAIDPARPAVDPKFDKQIVEYSGGHAAGTIVIDTPNRFLYLVQSNGRALRYGIGVGRPGFTWAGVKTVSAKKEWPAWTPPPEMLKRRPDLPRHMEGGPDNPLGARAMYLGSSLYRIHGSNEPWTIGTAVSSGCIRMRNEDVIDLYGRVNVGARVVVI